MQTLVLNPPSLKERIEREDVDIDMSQFSEFIGKMNDGEFSLSYSSLKEFAISPLSFLRYKCGLKEETDSMRAGSMQHCLILEPKEFYNRYVILAKCPGFESFNWNKKENKAHKIDVLANAEAEGKTVVTEDEVLKALTIKELLLSNTLAGDLIRGCEFYEKKISFKWMGIRWTGFIDGGSFNYLIDLKKVTDARPSKIRWIQSDRKFPWQAFLYKKGMKSASWTHFYSICYDSSGNICVLKQSDFDLQKAQGEIKKSIKKLKECIIGDNWNYSLEYYSKDGYYLSSEI